MTELPEDAGGLPLESLSAQQASADVADLRAGIDDLAGLVVGRLGLPELLAEVSMFAVHAIPGADGVGVTLLRVDRVDNMVGTLAASAPFVAEIDEIQYVTLKEGPCITAALQRRTVRSGSLGGEKMWPRFGPQVGRLGVHSALSLSLPLLLSGQVIGAINVYAHSKDVFAERDRGVNPIPAASFSVTFTAMTVKGPPRAPLGRGCSIQQRVTRTRQRVTDRCRPMPGWRRRRRPARPTSATRR